MTSIAVSELRANLMKVLEEIKAGAQIQITSRGKVIAELVPADTTQNEAKETLSKLADDAEIGEILKPIDEIWEVESN